MAYIVSVTQTATFSGSSYTVTLGAHVSGDLLLVCLSQDGGGTAIAPDATSTTAGWAMIGTGAASQGCRGQWAYLIADSASEVNPVFTGANDDWIGTCIVIRDAHATAPLGSVVDGTDYKKADWGNSTNINYGDSGAITTAVDECLLIYSWCSDGNTQYPICKLSELTCLDKYTNTQIAHIIGYKQQQTAGAAPTVRMYSQVATEGGTGWVLAIRNKTGGVLQPDLRPGVTQLKWHGSWETQQDSITWQSPSNFAASINSITCSSTAPTVTYSLAAAQTPWGVSTGLASTESTAGSWVGGTFTISSTDMTNKVFAIQYALGLTSANAIAGSDGVIVGFSDGTNWVAYQIISKAKSWLSNNEDTAFIALGNATAYASSGSINWGAVTRIGYFKHRVNSVTTSISFYVKHAALFDTTALTGGGAARPATFQDFQKALNSWGTWKWAEIQASSQIMAKASLQIGDGTNATYFDGAAQSLEYPQAWSASSVDNWQMTWNAAANSVGLSVYAKSGDTINLASGVASTDTAQNLSINASSATYADATYSFAQSYVGWRDPIDNKGLTWTGATFKECGTVTIAGGGDLTNCTIAKTTSTHAPLTITANGTVVTNSTITVADTSITTAHHISFGASVTSCTLNGVTLSGAAGTDKIYSALASGTLTITVDGTGTALVAGDVTFVGGSTAVAVIAAPQVYQKVTVSGITTGARVQIYDTTSNTELFNGTASAGDTVVTGSTVVWTDPAAASANRAIRIRVAYVSGVTAKNFIETSGLTCGQTSGTAEITYPVSPTDDTVYNANGENGSTIYGGGEITFVDSSPDRIEMNMAAGTLSLQKQYAAWVYYAFTSAGIATDIDYINAIDTANYEFTNITWKNTSSPAAPLKITGGYAWDSSTLDPMDLIDTTGGTIFLAPAHVVAYATGSGVTAQDVADIAAASATAVNTALSDDFTAIPSAVLSAAQTTPIHSNVKKVNDTTIAGSGVPPIYDADGVMTDPGAPWVPA